MDTIGRFGVITSCRGTLPGLRGCREDRRRRAGLLQSSLYLHHLHRCPCYVVSFRQQCAKKHDMLLEGTSCNVASKDKDDDDDDNDGGGPGGGNELDDGNYESS